MNDDQTLVNKEIKELVKEPQIPEFINFENILIYIQECFTFVANKLIGFPFTKLTSSVLEAHLKQLFANISPHLSFVIIRNMRDKKLDKFLIIYPDKKPTSITFLPEKIIFAKTNLPSRSKPETIDIIRLEKLDGEK